MVTFHKRLAKAREAVGLNQTELGQAVGAAQSTVATWERGKNEPDLKTISRIAKVVRRPPEWLAFNVNQELTESLALISEIDVRAPSGNLGLLEVSSEGHEDMTLRRYGFPREQFKELFGATPDGIVIVEVIGDSMFPTLAPGQRVFVDTTDRRASPPGIFVLWDGLGLVLKRVEFVAHSDPPRVRIISDNPSYKPYERELEDAHIQGRVIGSLQRR